MRNLGMILILLSFLIGSCSSSESGDELKNDTQSNKLEKVITETYKTIDSLENKIDSMEVAIDTMDLSDSMKEEIRTNIALMRRIISDIKEQDEELMRILYR